MRDDALESTAASAAEMVHGMRHRLSNVVYGTPETVRDGLDALVQRTGADELVITANAHTPAARLRSYELIADAYGFPNRA